MTLMIYNTLTRSKIPFEPIRPGEVTMYVCGPTVYDYIHLGNARPGIFFDVARRYLEAIGYKVKYIVNFTDVDDKLIRKAEQTGSTVPEVAEKYIQAYYNDVKALGIRPATANPRVTEHIDDIIAFIQGLMDQGYAYEKGGDVFFRTTRYAGYGELSHQNLDELQFGIRIDVDERKENPLDFVLWKQAKPGEIYWPSPWGDGRPGWHIECSAMSKSYLGETIDIHGGGHDLQFPHHECERAQSEAFSGKTFARYWMHNGYIHINNEKMSKSLGNGINVNELLKRVRPGAVRYFMLSVHYRSPLNFTDETIQQAENSIQRIETCVDNVRHRLKALGPLANDNGELTPELAGKLEAIRGTFHAEMQDDFNTPNAITALFELVSEANQYLRQERTRGADLRAILGLFEEMNDVLGLLIPDQTNELMDDEIEKWIAERTEARRKKDWARADEIRDMLLAQGIQLEDTPQGVRWRRK